MTGPGAGTRLAARAAGLAVLGVGLGSAGAATWELATGGPHVAALAGAGILALAVGAGLARLGAVPEHSPASAVLGAALVAWVALIVAGAVPYVLAGTFSTPFDAVFESTAGATTTNMTALSFPQAESEGLLLWRAWTQWLGGLGTVFMIGAVLPSVGAAGLSPLTPSGHSAGHLSRRTRDTARRLVPVYVAFTVLVTVAYGVAGMSPFDAVAHGLTTSSTGGFSTHRDSFAAFGSPALEWVAVVAMVIAGISVPLLWQVVRGRPGPVLRAVEVRWYLAIVVGAAVVAVAWNAGFTELDHTEVRHSVFTMASAASTTGYWVTGIGGWLAPAQALLLLVTALGPCTGSTGGGFKVERGLGLVGWVRRELAVQLHPNLVRPVRIGRVAIDEERARGVVGYFTVTMVLALAAMVVIAALGTDMLTSVSGTVSALSNTGPAFGLLAPPEKVAALDGSVRVVLGLVMLLGRLEVLTVLVGLGSAIHAVRTRARRLTATRRRSGRVPA